MLSALLLSYDDIQSGWGKGRPELPWSDAGGGGSKHLYHASASASTLAAAEVVGEETLVVAPLLMGAAPLRHAPDLILWPLW